MKRKYIRPETEAFECMETFGNFCSGISATIPDIIMECDCTCSECKRYNHQACLTGECAWLDARDNTNSGSSDIWDNEW